MISIKRFLDQRRAGSEQDANLVEALTQVGRLFLDAMATHVVRGIDADYKSLRRELKNVARQMEGPLSPMTLLGISSDAVEALETYCERTTAYFRAQQEERRSMIAMLTETVAELSGQTDASVARLQAIEMQVERASELDDIRTLRASLGDTLHALREAAAQQRNSSTATAERLQNEIVMARNQVQTDAQDSTALDAEIDLLPELSCEPVECTPTSYVAAFKLQRAEHIESRFGDAVKGRMLGLIATQLKTAMGSADRLLRWKGTSFVMFINSTETIQDLRLRLGETVAATGHQYVEVRKKSVMLSVGIDWIVFPQPEGLALDAVFAQVDGFLANLPLTSSPVVAKR